MDITMTAATASENDMLPILRPPLPAPIPKVVVAVAVLVEVARRRRCRRRPGTVGEFGGGRFAWKRQRKPQTLSFEFGCVGPFCGRTEPRECQNRARREWLISKNGVKAYKHEC